jgi:hypothetical protein
MHIKRSTVKCKGKDGRNRKMEWQGNTGVAAQEVFQEAQRFGEMGSDPSQL